MQYDDVILGRRSIRGYKPDPVPKALIEEIIGLAMRAPSSMNTQPWNFYVISGAPLDRIRAGNTERMVAGVAQSREFRTGQAFAGQHRDRQVGVAKQLFSAMGIERDDKLMRQDWVLRGFRQFDAPAVLFLDGLHHVLLAGEPERMIAYDDAARCVLLPHVGRLQHAPLEAAGDRDVERVLRDFRVLLLLRGQARNVRLLRRLNLEIHQFAPPLLVSD